MKNSETGEYELVVGNPQLLSAFFIVVLLCGVAFGMGYVMGQSAQRSKAPADTANAATNAPSSGVSQPVAPPALPAQSAADQAGTQPAASDSAAAPSEPAAPQPTTQPARETQSAAAPAPAQAPPTDAPAGSYWQVAAFKAASDAQPIVHTLQDGGMPVTTKTFPDGLVHVLVGPYADARALSNARQELTTRFGIRSPIRK